MPLITCQDVSLAYENSVVITNLSFNVEKGDYLCIVGENGSGKSTLMKGLLGLMKPVKGNILTGDGLKSTEIGYLPQQTGIQKHFPASVGEVVLSGCLNRKRIIPFYTPADRQIAMENLKRMGMDSFLNQSYGELSGGQQQRVLLARALCATDKLLILDEPIAGLDPLVAKDLYSLIRELNQQEHITIIMVSHDIQAAVENAGKILHLFRKSLFFGSSADYAESEIGKRYLGGESL